MPAPHLTPLQERIREEQEIRRVDAATAREERERKKAAKAGRIKKAAETRKAHTEAARITRASTPRELPIIFKTEKPLQKTPSPVNHAEYIESSGGGFCYFSDGPKRVTRTMSQRAKGSGRIGVKAVPHPDKHNDRFETEEAMHIDKERSKYNVYYNIHDGVYTERERSSKLPFWKSELEFCKAHFSPMLESQNNRHRKVGHRARVRDIDDEKTWQAFKKNKPPFEMIITVGNMDDSAEPETLLAIAQEFFQEMEKRYNAVTLNYALHSDEQGAPHIHARMYFIARDEHGNEIPNRDLALHQCGYRNAYSKTVKTIARRAGMKLSDKDAPSRHYNRTISFTDEYNALILGIARRHGIDVIEEARPRGKQGRDLSDYVAERDARAAAARRSLTMLREGHLSRSVRESCVLDVLEGIAHGLERYPAVWQDEDRREKAKSELLPALKKSRQALEALPALLQPYKIPTPFDALKTCHNRIKRANRSAFRQKSDAAKAKANDGTNERVHREAIAAASLAEELVEVLRQDARRLQAEEEERLDLLRRKDAEIAELQKKLAAHAQAHGRQQEKSASSVYLAQSKKQLSEVLSGHDFQMIEVVSNATHLRESQFVLNSYAKEAGLSDDISSLNSGLAFRGLCSEFAVENTTRWMASNESHQNTGRAEPAQFTWQDDDSANVSTEFVFTQLSKPVQQTPHTESVERRTVRAP